MEGFKAMASQIFEDLSERYDRWYDEHPTYYQKELSIIPPPNPPSLEIGVGTGRFAAPLGIDVGLDSSVRMLKIAVERGVECVAGDAGAEPFRDESFTTAYLIFTLCFLDDPVKALAEARRVLKKDGMLVACIVPSDSGLGREYMRKDSPFYKVATFFPEEVAAGMIAEAGFKVIGKSKAFIKHTDNDFVCYKAVPE